MMFRTDQPTFSGGEIGPGLLARVDTAKYRTALRRARNVFGVVSGGVQKRQGFGFVGQAIDSTSPVRVIPFQFDADQSLVLEFGNGTIRFISEAGYVIEQELVITAATQTDPVQITSPGHPYAAGQQVYIDGVQGMVQLNGRTFTVGAVAGNSFTLEGVDGTGYTAFTGDTGGSAYVAPAPPPASPPPGQSTGSPSTGSTSTTSPPVTRGPSGPGRYALP